MGFQLDGFWRSLQGNVMFTAGVIIAVVILGVVICVLIRIFNGPNEEESAAAYRIVKIIAAVVILIALAAFCVRALFVDVANYTPRQDVDKSSVYEQMESH